jgi:hypothetical protein
MKWAARITPWQTGRIEARERAPSEALLYAVERYRVDTRERCSYIPRRKVRSLETRAQVLGRVTPARSVRALCAWHFSPSAKGSLNQEIEQAGCRWVDKKLPILRERQSINCDKKTRAVR